MRLLDNNCVSAYQAKTIASMFLNEANRLDFAQYAFDKCIDPENYYALLDCFSSFSSAFILYDYMSHRSGFMEPVRVMDPVVSEIPSQVPVQMQCVVTPVDLEMIKNIIKNESFEGNKESTAKNAIASKACFSTQQIIEILKLFTYENTKVALAKYCFDYCIDVPNYYQVSTIFTYSTSKTDFNAFLAAKQR